MAEIKTREKSKGIKALDKAVVAGERMKRAFVRSKDQAENLLDDGQISPSEYAEDKVRYMAEDTAREVGHEAGKLTGKAKSACRSHREAKHTADEQALFVGDILATGFWAAKISEIKSEDTVLIIGAGPTGICTLLCAALKEPKRIIVCEKDPARLTFVREHYPKVLTCTPEECEGFVLLNSDHGGADVVLEVAGGKDTFRLAWRCARPNAIVTVVALYDEAQTLPLPEMYGKNLTFKTGGVDGCDCAEILRLIEQGKLDTTPLITHRFPLSEIEEAYRIFENRLDGVIKVAITADKPQKFGRQ